MFETTVIIFILGNLFLKKFVNNLDITKVLENFTLYSEFSHENYDQLIAGNLKMIKSNKLHKLFSRGFNSIQNGGECKKVPPTSFSTVTSTNVRISSQNQVIQKKPFTKQISYNL